MHRYLLVLCSHCMENIQNFGTKVRSRLLFQHFGSKTETSYCSHILESKQDFCSNILNAKEDFVKTWWLWSKLRKYFGCKTLLLFRHFGCEPMFWFKHLGCEKLALFKHFEREEKLVLMRSHTFVQTRRHFSLFLSFFFFGMSMRIWRGFPTEISAGNVIGMCIPANTTAHAPTSSHVTTNLKEESCVFVKARQHRKKFCSQNVGTKVLPSIQTVSKALLRIHNVWTAVLLGQQNVGKRSLA